MSEPINNKLHFGSGKKKFQESLASIEEHDVNSKPSKLLSSRAYEYLHNSIQASNRYINIGASSDFSDDYAQQHKVVGSELLYTGDDITGLSLTLECAILEPYNLSSNIYVKFLWGQQSYTTSGISCALLNGPCCYTLIGCYNSSDVQSFYDPFCAIDPMTTGVYLKDGHTCYMNYPCASMGYSVAEILALPHITSQNWAAPSGLDFESCETCVTYITGTAPTPTPTPTPPTTPPPTCPWINGCHFSDSYNPEYNEACETNTNSFYDFFKIVNASIEKTSDEQNLRIYLSNVSIDNTVAPSGCSSLGTNVNIFLNPSSSGDPMTCWYAGDCGDMLSPVTTIYQDLQAGTASLSLSMSNLMGLSVTNDSYYFETNFASGELNQFLNDYPNFSNWQIHVEAFWMYSTQYANLPYQLGGYKINGADLDTSSLVVPTPTPTPTRTPTPIPPSPTPTPRTPTPTPTPTPEDLYLIDSSLRDDVIDDLIFDNATFRYEINNQTCSAGSIKYHLSTNDASGLTSDGTSHTVSISNPNSCHIYLPSQVRQNDYPTSWALEKYYTSGGYYNSLSAGFMFQYDSTSDFATYYFAISSFYINSQTGSLAKIGVSLYYDSGSVSPVSNSSGYLYIDTLSERPDLSEYLPTPTPTPTPA